MKRYYYYCRLQVYMYDFMYVDTDTMTEEYCFPDTKTFVKNHKKSSSQGPVPKNWLEFSYIYLKKSYICILMEQKQKEIQTTHKKTNFKHFEMKLWSLDKNGFLI